MNYLLRINPNKIIVSLNNDSGESMAGNIGSEKVKNRLLKYLDRKNVDILLPPKEVKDWNDYLLKYDKKQLNNFIISNHTHN